MLPGKYDLIPTNEGPEELLAIPEDIERRAYVQRCMRAVTVGGGEYAEFGVASGASARIILQDMPPNKKLYLFDSFEGLPEKWLCMPKGYFKCNPPIFSPQETILVKGLFADTLKIWAPRIECLAFLHIDSDLYSSAKTILDYLAHAMVSGTVIMFDEVFGFEGWEDHEYRAWQEHCAKWGITYRWIARTGQHTRAGRDNYKACLQIC